jgi:hypothetical protein
MKEEKNKPKTIKGKHGGTLKPIQKGEVRNPIGRPRKYVSQIIDKGFTKREIEDTFSNLLTLTFDQLKRVFNDDRATMLEKIVAASLTKSVQRGSLDVIETMLSRVHGKPVTQIAGKDGESLNIAPVINVIDIATADALKRIAKKDND